MKIRGISESVAQYIRDLILSGELPPGQRLSEDALAAKLNVSRSPVREALRALTTEQIVKIIPRKGAYVTELSAPSLENAFDVREMVGCYTIDTLAQNNVTHLPEVEAAFAAGRALENIETDDRGGLLRYLYAMAAFHIKWVESTGNRWIISLAKNVQNYIGRYQFFYLKDRNRRHFSTSKHEELLNLISEEKYGEAKKRLEELIRNAKRNLGKFV